MRGRLAAVAAAVFALAPSRAWAHAPIEGIGDFYSGLLHPVLVPAHALAIAATGFLLGQRGRDAAIGGLAAFAAALLAGLALAGAGYGADSQAAVLAIAASAGLVVAASAPLPRIFCWCVSGAGGLLIGLDSAPETDVLRPLLVTLGGTAAGATILSIYAAGLADYVSAPWQRIGIRVAGSWIAASAVLVLALVAAGKTE